MLWNDSSLGVGVAMQTIVDPTDMQPIVSDGQTGYKLDRRTGNIIWSNLKLNCDEIELSLGIGTFYCGYYNVHGSDFKGFSLSQYSLSTGKLIWTTKPGVTGKMVEFSWPPVSIGKLSDRVYTIFTFNQTETLMAVSAKDGSLIWNVAFPPTLSHLSGEYPYVYSYQGQDILMVEVVENFPSASGRIGFIAYDGKSGKLLWLTYLSTFGQSLFSFPSVDASGTMWIGISGLFTDEMTALHAIDVPTGKATKFSAPVTSGNIALVSLGTVGTSIGCGCFQNQFSAFLLPSL